MNKKGKNVDSGNMGRRDFIRKSTMVCCLANIPFAASTLYGEDKKKVIKSGVKPGELVAYCGLYCGACDIYQKRISKSGKDLKKVLNAYNFKEIAKQVPGLEDYEAFDRTLTTIIAFFGQCLCCKRGGGDPGCKIRICCKEKGFKTCAECPSVPCEKLEKVDSFEFLTEIKEVGLEKWAYKQKAKVAKGFRACDYILEKKSKSKAK